MIKTNLMRFTRSAGFAVMCAGSISSAAWSENNVYDAACKAYAGGNYSDAKTQFLQVVKAYPSAYMAHYYLANTYMKLHDNASARQEYQKTIEANPSDEVRRNCEKVIGYLGPAAGSAQSKGGSGGSTAGSSAATEGAAEDNSGTRISSEAQRVKERIMADAQRQAEKIRADARAQVDESNQTSNQLWLYNDGSIKNGIGSQEEGQIMREAENKATAIMQEARRRAASIK